MFQDIFPTPIYQFDFIRDFNTEEISVFEEILKEIQIRREKLWESNFKGQVCQSEDTFILDTYKQLSDLREFIEEHIKIYTTKIYGKSKKQKIQITQSWINETKKGEDHRLHSHPNSFISGVFYYKCLDVDYISFQNPNLCMNMHHLNGEKHSIYNTSNLDLSVYGGLLILFPSWLHHKVHENLTEKSRVSLSFNTKIVGEAGSIDHLTHCIYT